MLLLQVRSPGPDLPDAFSKKKTQRCKRPARPDKDRAPPKCKRRKKEEDEKVLHSFSSTTSSSDPLVTHLRQVKSHLFLFTEQEVQSQLYSLQMVLKVQNTPLHPQLAVLPLMEPVMGVDLSLFPPYGSSSLGRDSRLSGSFGNACLDGVTDYYSQLIYKVVLQEYCNKYCHISTGIIPQCSWSQRSNGNTAVIP